MPPSDLIFEVYANEREYRIYASGRVEGFGGEAKITNHFYRVFARLQQEEMDAQAGFSEQNPADQIELLRTVPTNQRLVAQPQA
jgi:hypothetical protein